MHDKRNLEIIYGVIELKDPDQPGGRKINHHRIKDAKKKYRQILAKLMRGEAPSGAEEQHVADLFGPNAQAADYRMAMQNIRCQVGQKDRFREGVIRSGAYIEEIKQIFRELDLPEDLAYLPHVESSFNPKAYSKFGAAGIWQFTHSTGRRYMRIGYTVDERRDPIISSRAAAKLLKDNFYKLHNWPMAITAYNHGSTGMLRAKRRKGGYETIFKEYRSRIFKFASRNFYSEFLAARDVAKNYYRYFGDLKLDSPVNTTVVILEGYASLPEIARYLKLDIGAVSELNPALRKPVIRGQKYVPQGYRLRLPEDTGHDWKGMIAELSPKLFKHFQKRSRIYTVRRGDTAGQIAKIHGVKLRDLIAANNLDASATIFINQNLRIPLPDEKPVTLAELEERKQNERQFATSPKSTPNQEGQPLTTPTVDMLIAMNTQVESPRAEEKPVADSALLQPAKPAAGSDFPSFIASRKPEDDEEMNLAEPLQSVPKESAGQKEAPGVIASIESYDIEDWKVTETDLAKEQPTVLAKEQPTVSIPQVNPEIIQANLAVERVWNQNGKSVGAIRVEVEETLGHYAEWLAVTAWEIRRLNGFAYGQIIRLDQQIKIPLDRVSKEEFEEKRFEYHKELTEDFFASYRVEKIDVYYIKKGDNIWTLSRDEFEVPLWLLKRYNTHLDFSALMPSQQLLIPVVEKDV